jgi:hypothetical protein
MSCKSIIIICCLLVALASCSNNVNDETNFKTLDGKAPRKYLMKFESIENRTEEENSKCQKHYEGLFVVSSTTSDSSVIWSKIPTKYNMYFNQDLNEGSKGILQ